MASTKEYLDFVLDLLSEAGEIRHRAMMGEYIIYCDGKVIGGVYDDRFLLKATPGAIALMGDSPFGAQTQTPYPGAKEMLVANVDDTDLTCRAVRAIVSDTGAV